MFRHLGAGEFYTPGPRDRKTLTIRVDGVLVERIIAYAVKRSGDNCRWFGIDIGATLTETGRGDTRFHGPTLPEWSELIPWQSFEVDLPILSP